MIITRAFSLIYWSELLANSIGKSTLLMIIDFIFGGDSYIEHNDDVVSELGHHEFFYI
ncbi:hypothetical protein ABFT51_12925 [Paenibacillus peoriae]|uniref:hypothetical protein n=1 Tax=Paenibacillus peoriae TaxID=59893 RepID=UPI0032AFF8D3